MDQTPFLIKHRKSQENEVVRIRKIAPCYGAKRLKYFFDLKPSLGAIERIIRDYGLVKKRRKKYQKKNDLRAIKARYQSFEKLQMDVKYLTDIPPYWERMKKLKLPRFQYTVRDVKSGMLFLGFADELSSLHAQEMVKYVLSNMAPYFPGTITVQTDNGVEFSGTTRKHENNHFRNVIKELGAEHVYIPPGHCNANADVESIHATIESEFYNLTEFTSRKDFLKKAESYRLFYNLERPNFSKGRKTPWLIAQEDHPNKDFATSIQFTNVVDLDCLLKAKLGGHQIPVFPVRCNLLKIGGWIRSKSTRTSILDEPSTNSSSSCKKEETCLI